MAYVGIGVHGLRAVVFGWAAEKSCVRLAVSGVR